MKRPRKYRYIITAYERDPRAAINYEVRGNHPEDAAAIFSSVFPFLTILNMHRVQDIVYVPKGRAASWKPSIKGQVKPGG